MDKVVANLVIYDSIGGLAEILDMDYQDGKLKTLKVRWIVAAVCYSGSYIATEVIENLYYGEDVETPASFAARYCGLTDALVQNEKICGFCYTQLYDIEQEQNGLYTYDRQKKFSDEIYDRIRASNAAKAAIED